MVLNSLSYLNFKGIMLSLQQIFLDASHPIGSTYTQYPQQASPMELFNNDSMQSTWEILPYNGAFFRSCNVPKLLYTTNGEDFFIDVEFIEKIDISDHSLWAVTDTGDRTYNSKGEEIQIWKGSWLEGHADSYIEKTGVLVAQKDCIRTHSITVTGGNHNHAIGAEWSADGNVFPRGYYTTGASRSSGWSGNLTLTGTYGNATSNPETRPVNYTIRIWKRIS